jgi:hypothetical protein
MKKVLVVLLFLLTSAAHAQSSSIALRFGIPFLVSVGYEYNFEAHNRGLGIRAFVGGTYVANTGLLGIAVEGLYRFPIGDFGSSFYTGLGIGASLTSLPNPTIGVPSSPSGSNSTGALGFFYFHLGAEWSIGNQLGLTLEMQPIGVFLVNRIEFYALPILSLGLRYRF